MATIMNIGRSSNPKLLKMQSTDSIAEQTISSTMNTIYDSASSKSRPQIVFPRLIYRVVNKFTAIIGVYVYAKSSYPSLAWDIVVEKNGVLLAENTRLGHNDGGVTAPFSSSTTFEVGDQVVLRAKGFLYDTISVPDDYFLVDNSGGGSSKSYQFYGQFDLKGMAFDYESGVLFQRVVTLDELLLKV